MPMRKLHAEAHFKGWQVVGSTGREASLPVQVPGTSLESRTGTDLDDHLVRMKLSLTAPVASNCLNSIRSAVMSSSENPLLPDTSFAA